jgi:hypothetical protein
MSTPSDCCNISLSQLQYATTETTNAHFESLLALFWEWLRVVCGVNVLESGVVITQLFSLNNLISLDSFVT